MSHRRLTPQGKSSNNSWRTPTNLNATVSAASRSATLSVRGSSSRSNLDLTTIGNRTGNVPKIKPNIVSTSQPIDPELERDLAYGQYLQSVMKRHLVSLTEEKRETELQDQLDIQDDALFLKQMQHKDLQQELKQQEALEQANHALAGLEQFIQKYKHKCEGTHIDDILQELKSTLEAACHKLHLKNIKSIPSTDQDQLMEDIDECLAQMNKLKLTRDLMGIEQLAANVKRFNELKSSVKTKNEEVAKIEKDLTFKVAKSASDFFAKKRSD